MGADWPAQSSIGLTGAVRARSIEAQFRVGAMSARLATRFLQEGFQEPVHVEGPIQLTRRRMNWKIYELPAG